MRKTSIQDLSDNHFFPMTLMLEYRSGKLHEILRGKIDKILNENLSVQSQLGHEPSKSLALQEPITDADLEKWKNGSINPPKRRIAVDQYIKASLANLSQNKELTKIHELNQFVFMHRFEAYAKYYPDHPAILFKDQTWTYAQVNSRANELANFLLKQKEAAALDPSKEFIIGTFLPREPEWIIAILAIWKAGAAFIAIDPTAIGNSPDAIDDYFEKFSQILSDAKPAFILTHSDHQYLLPKSDASGFSCLCLDECEEEIDKWSDENLDIKIDPEDLAYILYTSGSTGKPKGVEIAHRGFMPCLEAHRECVDLTRESIMAQYATCDFDAWVAEMLILGIGGTLAIVPSDIRLDETRCARYYQDHKINVAIFTPAFLNKLGGPENFPLWRALFIVGESFDWELVKKWKTDKLQIVNGYGLTETTICATLENLDIDDVGKPLSIGKPILGTKILIKIPTNIDINNPDIEKDYGLETTYQDPESSSSAIDQAGEPWFGGLSLTRGYRGEAMQNNAWRFVEIEGERYYKSGDKAILRADGRLEHQGRYSRMVKISGKRIELPSIEANLCQHFQLEKMAVAVTAVGNSLDDKNLSTILVFLKENEQKKIDLEEIRRFIINNEKNIDKQMPLHILSKTAFPTTQTKINLTELNKSYFESHTKLSTTDPATDYKFISKETDIFKKLKECWTRVISTENLIPEDDFFLMGGRSIDISPLIQSLRLAFPEIKEEINNNLVIECKTLLSQTKRLYTLLHPIELIPLKKKQKAEAPYIIFCPPSILGDPEQDFSELLAQSDTDFKKPIFDDRFQIYGLKARGLNDPSLMPTSLYSMAQDYALTIKGWLEKDGKEDRPVFILGWSSGGTVTPEIVNALEKYDVQAYAYVCDSIAPFPFHHFNHEEHTRELILLAGKLCQAIGLKIETQDLKSELSKIQKPRDRIVLCFDFLIQRAKINHRNILNTAKIIRLAEHNYIIRDKMPSIRLFKAKHYLLEGISPKDRAHYWPKNCIHRLDEIEDNTIEGNHFEMIQQRTLAQKITAQIIQDFTYHKLKKLTRTLEKQANYVVPFIEIVEPNLPEEEENTPDILFSHAITDFLADPEKTVVLLQGESGLGKSMGTLQLEKSLKAINIVSKIIILNRHTCEELKKSIREELSEWQKDSIEIRVLILEGYDERRGTIDFNYYDTNGLADYQNLKVIFTCRSETLKPGYLTNFIPGEREALAEMKLQPFTEDQIKSLMSIRLTKNKSNSEKIEINKLYEEISSRPELLELVKNPLLLTFVLKSLPTLIKSTVALTRFKIYEAFNNDYFERGELKIKSQSGIEDDQDFRMDCRLHCQRVALTFFSEGLTSYEVRKNKSKSLLNTKKKTSRIFDDLFSKEKKQILKASPIKNNNNIYEFNHKTEIDFFVVDALISIFKEQDADYDDFQSWFIDNKLTPDKLVSNESIIKFWDDAYKKDPFLKAILFKIIDATRDSVNLEKIGGIAITLLNMASENFNGANFTRIRVPGANLVGGYFDCTDFAGSDLKMVKFDRAWLRNAKLINCQLNEVSFGEYPYFEHEDVIKSMVYRPDINVLVTLTGTTVYIWDIVKGEIIQELKNESAKSMNCMHMSGNGEKLALAIENTIKVYDLTTGKSTILKGHEKTVWSVFLSEDGETVASGSADKTIRVWHVSNNRKTVVLRGHKKIISKIHMSNDGLRVISGSYMNDDRSIDDTVRVWDVETRKSIVLEANHRGGRCVYLSGDGRTAVTATFDHTVLVWNAQTGKNIYVLEGHKSFVKAVDLSINGKTLISCSDDYTIRVWDVPSGESKVLRGYELSPGNVQFSKDEVTVASTDGHKVRIWDISSARPEVLRSHKGCVGYVHLSSGGQMVASMSGDVLIEDNKVRLHDLVNGQSIVLMKHKHSRNLPVYLSKDGRIVATSVRKNSVGVWDVESRQLLLSADHGASLSALHLSRDGKTVATGGGSKFEIPDYSVRVWNVASGQAVVLEGHENEIRYVYLSADGRTVASASLDDTVRIWDVASRQVIVLQIKDCTHNIRLSENGKKIALITTSHNEIYELVFTISVRNLPDCKEISLVSRNERIEILQLSNDGKAVIACIRKNKRLNIWDMSSQKNLGLILFNSEVNAISIDDSLSILVVGLKDSTVQVWDRQPNQSSQWNLRWSSNYPNLSLQLTDCDYTGSQGLTAQNERLLIQGGAINSEKTEKLNSIEAWNKFSVVTTADTKNTKKEPSDDEDFSPNIDQITTLYMN